MRKYDFFENILFVMQQISFYNVVHDCVEFRIRVRLCSDDIFQAKNYTSTVIAYIRG